MPAARPRTAEDEEFAEADEILAELRRRAASGEADLPWGDCVGRSWTAEGKLCVTREYAAVPGGPSVLLRELPYSAHPDTAVGVNGTGGVVWAGALGLVEYLQAHAAEFLRPADCAGAAAAASGRLVALEIGAGCGLVGLCAAALAGSSVDLPAGLPTRVVLTDESEPVLDNLRHNAELNRDRLGGSEVEVARLEWDELLSGALPAPVEAVDLLLGSDVIWGHRGPLVGRVARRLVRPGGRLVVSAQEGREGLDAFEAILRAGPEAEEGPAFEVEALRAEAAGERLALFVCRRRRGGAAAA